MSTDNKQSEKCTGESKEVFEQIIENYSHLNQAMVREIELASTHSGTTGSYREEMWMKFFRSIIPLKYSLAQGVIIIDSYGNNSREVDIAVYDEQYTPYVFQYNTLKFIPIEAVAVAIECKSTGWDDSALKEWAQSILKLEPCASGIARMVQGYTTGITNTTQKRTRPILILASGLQRVTEDAVEGIEKRLGDTFDFILLKHSEINGKQQKFQLRVKNECKKLGWWGKQLNCAAKSGDNQAAETEDKDLCISLRDNDAALKDANEEGTYPELKFYPNSEHLGNTLADLRIPGNDLLTLNFQLNQLLMLLNNPMLFPHFAYANKFREIAEEIAKKKGCGSAAVKGEPDE